MTKRSFLIVFGIAILGVLWFLFRPDQLFTNKTVDESLPGTGTAKAFMSGQFHNAAHETSGTATIYRFAEGSQILRLTNLDTSNGPDLYVYLVALNDATDSDAVTKAGFINLGALHGNRGNQNYDVPPTADLSKYRAVAIWCRRFRVNFGTAPLMQH